MSRMKRALDFKEAQDAKRISQHTALLFDAATGNPDHLDICNGCYVQKPIVALSMEGKKKYCRECFMKKLHGEFKGKGGSR